MISFFAIIKPKNTDTFLNYYKKYNQRHIRVKHKNLDLYTTLFNIQIEDSKENELIVFGIANEDLNNYFSLRKDYTLVFNTDETILGKIKFIEFE